MLFPPDITSLAQKTIGSYAKDKKKIVTAESCTAGLIAGALTEIPGSSQVVERGFVAYSNEAKFEVLGVMPELIEANGAVSAEVAEAMAIGALEFSLADVSVAVTGIAGPDGGTLAKPVGLVFLGLATRAGVVFHTQCQFKGDRSAVRLQAVKEGLTMLSAQIGEVRLEF